jgi:hypothetical protein
MLFTRPGRARLIARSPSTQAVRQQGAHALRQTHRHLWINRPAPKIVYECPAQSSRTGTSERSIWRAAGPCNRFRRTGAGPDAAILTGGTETVQTYQATSIVFSRAGVSSARTQRNIELMRLIGRLTPDFKTIANSARTTGLFALPDGTSSCFVVN